MNREQRQAAGLCTRCGDRPLATKTMCRECADARNQVTISKKRRLQGQGLCTRCRSKPLATQLYCRECADKRAPDNRARRQRFADNGVCKNCGRGPLVTKTLCEMCASKYHTPEMQVRRLEQRRKLKRDVITAYGGKCVCCGETDIAFLTIDHINGGAEDHYRRIGGSGIAFHRWLRKNNYPEGFRVLCWNCNSGRAKNNDICPHHGDFRDPPNPNSKDIYYRVRLRQRLPDAYGNKCACCGETNPLFLTIDHINGGGRKHKAKLINQAALYVDAIRHSESGIYRLLCFNCNSGRAVNGGVCPHTLVIPSEATDDKRG